jgi:hypothetical protein
VDEGWDEKDVMALRKALVDAREWWELIRERGGYEFGRGYVEWGDGMSWTEWLGEFSATVVKVTHERHQRLAKRQVKNAVGGSWNRGKLAVFRYNCTLSDGLAKEETAGILDVHVTVRRTALFIFRWLAAASTHRA